MTNGSLGVDIMGPAGRGDVDKGVERQRLGQKFDDAGMAWTLQRQAVSESSPWPSSRAGVTQVGSA